MLSENEEKIRKELLKLKKHFQCPICLNLLSDPMVTRCVHHFCGECITKAIESSTGDYCRCPLCNEKITKRSLRSQLDVFDVIKAFKAAVDSFENDNQMSLITDDNDVIVFDVSSDKSKSLVSNDSFDSIDKTKDLDKSQNKSMDKNNGIQCSETEFNGKTVTSVSNESFSYETSNDCIVDIKDLEETDIYFESTENPMNENNESLEQEIDSIVEPIPTQSQNLKVTKSRITYSSSRPLPNDRFDRIIRLSEISLNMNESKERSKEVGYQKESRMEIDSLENEGKTNRRKPLTQLNRNESNKTAEKKTFKRIETFDSSGDEFDIIVTNTNVKDNSIDNIFESNTVSKAVNEVSHSYDDNSEDLFLPAIHN